jgi:hypothetical protein
MKGSQNLNLAQPVMKFLIDGFMVLFVDTAHYDYGLPSSSQGHGRDSTLPVEDFAVGVACQPPMAGTHPWVLLSQIGAQEKQQCFFHRIVCGAPLTLPGQILVPAAPPVERFVEELYCLQLLLPSPFTYG